MLICKLKLGTCQLTVLFELEMLGPPDPILENGPVDEVAIDAGPRDGAFCVLELLSLLIGSVMSGDGLLLSKVMHAGLPSERTRAGGLLTRVVPTEPSDVEPK